MSKGKPIDVKAYDFIDKKLGKAIPYGIYDIARNIFLDALLIEEFLDP